MLEEKKTSGLITFFRKKKINLPEGIEQILNVQFKLNYLYITTWASLVASGKEPACYFRRHKRHEFSPWVRKILWRRKWQPTPVFFPGESHGQRSLKGYSS